MKCPVCNEDLILSPSGITTECLCRSCSAVYTIDLVRKERAGVLVIIDMYGAQGASAKDVSKILEEAAAASNSKILHPFTHQFRPQGVTGMVIIEESHIFIHTWPEMEYVGCDIFTCGNGYPWKAARLVRNAFKPKRTFYRSFSRGHVVNCQLTWEEWND